MPRVLTPQQMPDAVIAVLDNMNKGKWIGEMTDLTDHVGFSRFVKGPDKQQSGGNGATVRYLMDHNHSAAHTGLFGTTAFDRNDALVEGKVRWTYTDANAVFDEREPSLNSPNELEIVDHVQIVNAQAMASLVELCEQDVWSKPESSADNDTPMGLEYWVTKHATVGYNGGDPEGFAAGRAGISSDDHARHKNFTGAYSTVDDVADTGLVWMMEQAADKTNWISPVPEPGMGRSSGSRIIACNWATRYALKLEAKSNNESIGYDLYLRDTVFRGAPFTYVPYFDAKADNPLYMLDTKHLYAMFMRGWQMKKKKVKQLPNQVHCFAIITSMVWNIICDDIRKQAVFHVAQ